VLGWPKRCTSAHAFLWDCSYERLKLAQVLGQLGSFLTCAPPAAAVSRQVHSPPAPCIEHDAGAQCAPVGGAPPPSTGAPPVGWREYS
jgi:hypothetical protein